jgi:hypothetical protein
MAALVLLEISCGKLGIDPARGVLNLLSYSA